MEYDRELERERRPILLKEYTAFLHQFEWNLIVHLTFPNALSREAMLARFKQWIRLISKQNSIEIGYAVVIMKEPSFHIHGALILADYNLKKVYCTKNLIDDIKQLWISRNNDEEEAEYTISKTGWILNYEEEGYTVRTKRMSKNANWIIKPRENHGSLQYIIKNLLKSEDWTWELSDRDFLNHFKKFNIGE